MKANTPITIEETASAMSELAYGERPPCMLSALRNSALSCRMKLHSNCGYALVLSKYRGIRLPERELLRAELSTAIRQDNSGKLAWGLMDSHLDTLYNIDAAWFSGQVALDYGASLESQRVWRSRIVELISGMGDKLVSWALFIYDPTGCKLMTVDCIHCDRLGIDQRQLRGTTSGHAFYCHVEELLRAECLALFPAYLPAIGAACLWLNHRRQGVTSHAGINCR